MTDAILAVIASKWRYHVVLMIMLCMQMLLMAFNNTAIVFYHDTQSHHCKVPQGQSLKLSLPPADDEDSGEEFSSCTMYRDPYNHSAGVKKCGSYDYEVEGAEWTVVNEWDLVCDLSYLPSMISSLYFCGMLVGALLFGDLADRFGRRPVIIIGMYIQTTLSIGIYFIQSLTGYVILRTLLGAVTDGLFATSMTLLMEFAPIHLRSHTGAVYSLFWGIGSIIMGIVAYFFHNWRHIQMAITIPFMFSCIYLLTIPESLRWLLSKGRIDDAKSTVRTYAKRNGVKLHPKIDDEVDAVAKEIKESTNNTTQYSYLDLIKTPEIRKRTLVLSLLICSMCVIYYGILFNITALSGNKYVNFLISASLEVASYLITIPLISRFKRKRLFIATVVIGVITCLVGVLIKRFTTDDTLSLVSSIFILLSKSSIVASFTVTNTYTAELFPTVVRNMGFSFILFFGRIGSLLAPQMQLLGQYTDRIVPFILFAVLYFGTGVLVLMLMETKDKPILETIQEIENMRQQKKLIEKKNQEKKKTCCTKLSFTV